MGTPKDIKLAKRLARIFVDAGEEALPELHPALEKILQGRSTADRKAFLKAFQKAAIREVKKDTLTVESARQLAPGVLEQLIAHFSEGRERSLRVVEATHPELIAGMRIRLGDTVYDASLANNLNNLSARIH